MGSNETNLYLVADEPPYHSSTSYNNYNNKTQLNTLQGTIWIF